MSAEKSFEDKSRYASYKRKLRLILDSATFALLFSVVLFLFEIVSSTRESEKIVDNLVDIQNSLSTRHLGLFPEYISNINSLLADAIEHQDGHPQRDSIVIFEDVLYYGIRSDAEGFRTMIENLLTLTNHGCYVTLAHYAVDGRPFKHMIRDKFISHQYQKEYRDDMQSYMKRLHQFRKAGDGIDRSLPKKQMYSELRSLLNQYFNEYFDEKISDLDVQQLIRDISNYEYVDSIVCHKYYKQTFEINQSQFKEMVASLLQPLPQKKDAVDVVSLRVNELFIELDRIKTFYMNKPLKDISYSDFYNMYKQISMAICDVLEKQHNLELIHLNETLMMCCWMSNINGKEKAIFAFPSKYSTDEIGFISQDVAIARYIRTMLNGIRVSHSME